MVSQRRVLKCWLNRVLQPPWRFALLSICLLALLQAQACNHTNPPAPASGAEVPDVYAITWPGILAENLVDLKAYVPAQEIAEYLPELSGVTSLR